MKNITVKICGITRVKDALDAARLGADMIGLIFAESARKIDARAAAHIVKSLPSRITTVGVFMNQPAEEVKKLAQESGVHMIQLHGNEKMEAYRDIGKKMIKRIYVNPDDTAEDLKRRTDKVENAMILFDPGAGSGECFDWSILPETRLPFILAGGLGPDNVKNAVKMTGARAVDVCSGVELSPGIKDYNKMKRFIEEVK